ncbi:delta-60 repeat domain-containing protein [Hymenobacter chitinivorans]|uniref:Beta-propeller uncharacterized protein DUF5122 n=1 Tax=Hymenobacter chitinivorans DSM 11115 TaxID=1121954 RepID=A0A2M9B5H9_9BACT|nr:delta-60 repeat domain-containing protein [Hymenobacter chitinivorans]PJJ53187.1 beta-propeller uncharacterized protein DUF5122 [Hymenobacter chitinivorans DSM 11115]
MKRFIRITALLVTGLSYYLPAPAQTLDPSFAAVELEKTGIIEDALLQADGKYVVGGTFTRLNGTAAKGLARLNANGTLDATFRTTGADAEVTQVTLQDNGRIVVGGNFTTVDGRSSALVAGLLADGSADASFTTTASYTTSTSSTPVLSLAPLPDGSLLVGAARLRSTVLRGYCTGSRRRASPMRPTTRPWPADPLFPAPLL